MWGPAVQSTRDIKDLFRRAEKEKEKTTKSSKW